MRRQPVAIVERLGEMPAGIDEQHGRGGIDGGDEMQQHRRFRPERGDDGDPAGKDLAQGRRQDALGRRIAQAPLQVEDEVCRDRHPAS